MLIWALRWLAAVLVIGAAYALLHGPEPAGSPKSGPAVALRPPETGVEAAAPVEHVIRAGRHGHFVVEAVIDGVPVSLLVDTGASDLVIAPEDARRLGHVGAQLRFDLRYETANGTVRAAPIRLRELRIGQLSLYDVDAAVTEGDLPVSLLGMSVLRRLGGYRVEGDRLLLYW
jgi:aspartyl protease family protein